MRKRPICSLILGVVLWGFWAACGVFETDDRVSGTDAVASESFAFNVPVAAQTRMRLDAINGNIQITGDPAATEVVITGEKRVGSETIADATAHLRDLQVEISELTEEILIETKQPRDTHGRNYVVDYVITIPQNLQVTVEHVNGNVRIGGLSAPVAVDLTNGNVDLIDLSADVAVDLVNGNIACRASMQPDGLIDLGNVNGNIALEIPKTTSATLSATVTNGTITTSNLDLQNETRTSRSLSAILGAGKGTIKLSTVNGIISVVGMN